MLLYDRVLAVTVGPPDGSASTTVSGLRVAFDVDKTSGSEANTFTVSLYNLGASNRAAFEKIGNRVTLAAGYAQQGPQVLAVGDIVSAEVEYSNADVVLRVEASDGGKALRAARATVSFSAGTPAKDMVQALAARLNIDMPELPVDLSGSFRNGWAFAGRVRDGLDQLAKRFGFDWSVQNNSLQMTTARQPSKRQAVLLSATSGLIGTPSPIDDVRGQDDKAKDKDQPGLLVRSLLNGALVPGDPLMVSSQYQGEQTYRVRNVRHKGDTHGQDWISEVECVEVP